MGGESILADPRIVHQAAFDHIPAERALQSTEQKYHRQLGRPCLIDFLAKQEIHKRQQEHQPDQASEQAMQVFPPENRLELGQAHPLVDLLIFRRLLIFMKYLFPLRLIERGQGADDGLPFDDGQAGVGQAGNTAYHNHGEHQGAAQQQPGRHLLASGMVGCRLRCGYVWRKGGCCGIKGPICHANAPVWMLMLGYDELLPHYFETIYLIREWRISGEMLLHTNPSSSRVGNLSAHPTTPYSRRGTNHPGAPRQPSLSRRGKRISHPIRRSSVGRNKRSVQRSISGA